MRLNPEMFMAKIELDDYLFIAKKAVSLAGDFLSERSQASTKVNLSEGKDIKLVADIESEKIIVKYLMKQTLFSILSEEKGFIQRENKGYMWVVDPLDGTMNYLRNIPICCVSIGLWHKGKPVLGVVNNFNSDDWYNSKAISRDCS